MNQLIRETLRKLPTKPGVYRFYGEGDNLLYIGKAKVLKNRVSSYFQEGRPKNQRLTLMISQISRIEYTVVKTEKESLILEANLIHNLQPKYNILLKDDKSYVYVRITMEDPIPGIFTTRRKYDPRSKYFGPYTRQFDINSTLRTLRNIFPYCQERTPQKKPCAYYGIKQCEGICAGLEDRDHYMQKIQQIINVLEGKTKPAEEYLQGRIKQAIEQENYELAALWRDRLQSLKATVVNQKIILPHPMDIDLISLVGKSDSDGWQIGSVFVQNIREGKIINVSNFILSGSEDLEGQSQEMICDFCERFFSSYYALKTQEADILLSTYELNQEETKRVFISQEQKSQIEEISGTRLLLKNTYELNHEEINGLVEQGRQNALIYLERQKLGQKLSLFEENNVFNTLVEIRQQLGLVKTPRRIECYDISHLSGKFVYGSMAVFEDGRPSKKNYRLFKTKQQNNDFENHREVLIRRFQEGLKEQLEREKLSLDERTNPKYNRWNLPDLIIVDGGKGQLSSDQMVLEQFAQEFEFQNTSFEVAICSLAKREEEIFVPDMSVISVNLPRGSEGGLLLQGQAKFLVQRIRDEAHRFAITNNRKARLKTIQKSRLDEIPGLGPKTKQKLLTVFGSTENLMDQVSKNSELLIELVGPKMTATLKRHFGI